MKIAVNKINLYVQEKQKEEVFKLLQRNELMMIEESNSSKKETDLGRYDELIIRVNHVIEYLEGFREKRKFFIYKEASYEDFDDRSGTYYDLLETLENLEEQENNQKNKIETLNKEIELYKPFSSSELNLEDMSNARYIEFYHSFIDLKSQEELKKLFIDNDIPHSFYEADKRGVALTFASLKDKQKIFLNEAHLRDFKELKMPKYDGSIKEYIENLEIEKTKYEVYLKETSQTIASYLEQINNLYIYADQLASDKLIKEAPYEVYSEELNLIMITGWIKAKREAELRELLTLNNFKFELENATKEEDEITPVALENNKFVEPFEVITEQFSAPAEDDLDPNPAMSFWYWIIFGIMMGDIGYGILLVLGCGLALKYLRPKGGTKKLVKVLYYGGYTTILFGILHGSLFGAAFDLGAVIGNLFGQNWTFVLLNPVDDALTMLIYSLVLGFVQISHGLILKAIRSLKNNDWQGAIGEGSANLIILLGLGLMVLTLVVDISIYVGVGVLLSGVLLVLLFAGNGDGIAKAISGKFGGLYGTINNLSDILSYSRLLALALSTAVIASTFNTLAGMLTGSVLGFLFAIIIYFIGHVFALAMGLLSAYIHDSRLQYVEFYGKFFDGGGRYFRPLSLKLNHLNEVINNKDNGGNK